jgi:hypothetical protein
MPLKPYNGTTFVEASELKVWNGSSWLSSVTARVWNGASWVIFHRGGAANFTTASYLTSGISDDQSGPTEFANVKYQINTDGYVYVDSAYSGLVQSEQWSTPTSVTSNFEIKATLSEGTIQSGPAFGEWLDMSTTRTWEKIIYENGASQNEAAVVSFEVRKKGSTTNLDTWTITFTVELDEIGF